MRKLIVFITTLVMICCLCISAVYADELTFQGIPWYSSPDETVKCLTDIGIVNANEYIFPVKEYTDKDSLSASHIGAYKKDKKIPYCYTFKKESSITNKLLEQWISNGKIGKTIASQEVKSLTLMYTPDDQCLVEICIWFNGDSYDIKAVYNALVSVYGKPNANRKDKEYVWIGDNNTIVILYKNDVVFATIDGLNEAEAVDLGFESDVGGDIGF